MKRYMYIENERVREILYEFTPDFPNTPIQQRYSQKFLENCVVVEDNELEIKEGMDYDWKTGEFTEHIDPEPEIIEENVEEVEANGKSEGNEGAGIEEDGGLGPL